MLSQSGAHQLVVDMILVSLEDRLVVQQTDDDNSYDVKYGHHKQRHCYQHRLPAVWHHVRIVHRELHKNRAKNVSEGQTARISHENLPVFLGISEDIEEEKRHYNSCQSGYEDAVDRQSLKVEAVEKSHKRYQAQRPRQSVDAVDEVEAFMMNTSTNTVSGAPI